MKKRKGYKYLMSAQSKKWIKENKCPNCGKPKNKWTRRKDWKCCSKKCSDEFYKNYKCISWQQFRLKALIRDKDSCVKCGDNRKKILIKGYKPQECPDWRDKLLALVEPDKIINNLIVDHIKPIALGGEEFDLDNLQTLCLKCNKIKTAKDMKDIAKQRRKEKEQSNNKIIKGLLE